MPESPDTQHEIGVSSTVTLHFSLSLTNGTEAISTFNEEPLTLQMGDGTFKAGMELALYGLKAGDEQTLTLTPEQAYGFADEELIHEMDISDFGEGFKPEAGQIIAFSMPNGEETPGAVLDVSDDIVKVDFNHPLSGHDVVFVVKILSVK